MFLQVARLHLEVRLASPRGLPGELRRFGPQIVVHAGPPVPIPDLLPCWVERSLDSRHHYRPRRRDDHHRHNQSGAQYRP